MEPTLASNADITSEDIDLSSLTDSLHARDTKQFLFHNTFNSFPFP